MKILVLSAWVDTIFFYREDMLKEMVKNGHEVLVGAPENDTKWYKKFEDMKIKYLSIKSINRTGMNPFEDLRAFLNILKVIKKIKPDKIFLYQAKPIIYGSIAAKILNIKEIYCLVSGLGTILRDEDVNKIKKYILQFEYKIAFKACKTIFVQNKDDLFELKKNKIVDEAKTIIINGSGVNMEKFRMKPLPKDGNIIFLFIGRILKNKGVQEYLEAAKIIKEKYKNVNIQILGLFDSNPSKISPEKMEEIFKSGIVEYLGYSEDVRPYIEKSCVFVLPSYHEGLPKSVLEAMSIGRPIITTDAPGCRETVIDGENGFLIPIKDAKSLVEKMIYMIENRDKLQAMGEKSYSICREKFDVKFVNDTILNTMGLK